MLSARVQVVAHVASELAAPQHVADVCAAVIDHLSPAELATLAAIGDKVRARLTALSR
ncbi:hypothetical protein Adu01nite_84330 [Paractinoplanes durhamensis]|uniref:MarR family transcriptional regulator n=1 Tax=Paractinoplanes durhamensis TaxID=113563 RepID=A0ABQ3ZB77_9ACTN|nr:hypothetical protein Adu01nite_84330 [Actinoplanes durhamensis]